jgi:cyanophycinase-like exopeptidase
VWDGIFHPVAEKVARRCDGCLRIGGPSAGADLMVSIFVEGGRPVWRSLSEVPAA